MLAHLRAPGQICGRGMMAEEEGKCPMGKNPWLATFLVVAFVLLFLAHKLGLV